MGSTDTNVSRLENLFARIEPIKPQLDPISRHTFMLAGYKFIN